jgi:hypothetical protein
MKISESTLAVLKNFSTINSNLYVPQGNIIRTVNTSKSVVAKYLATEEFPVEIGIFDLNTFLPIVALFEEPDFKFSKHFVELAENKTKVKYNFAEKGLLTIVEKDIKSTDYAISFNINSKDLKKLLKATSTMQLPDICISKKNDEILLSGFDAKNGSASHDYSIVVGEDKKDHDYNFLMKTELIKVIPGDYSVAISPQKIMQWTLNESVDADIKNLVYWNLLEKDSEYSE